MSKLLKFIGAQFGFAVGDEEDANKLAAVQIDPAARRLAEAEINGSLVLAEHRGKLPRDYNASPQVELPASAANAVGKDGNIDFDQFFSKANVAEEGCNPDQAIKIMENVDKTIPATISDLKQRADIVRNVVLGTLAGPAPEERLVISAKVRADALTSLMRQRLNITADYKQRAAQKIKELEAQIATGKAAIAAADKQFSTLAEVCQGRQAKYNALIDLFSQTDSDQPTTIQ